MWNLFFIAAVSLMLAHAQACCDQTIDQTTYTVTGLGPDPDDLPDVSTLLSDPDTGVWFNDNMAGFAISTETTNCQHFYQLHSFSVDIVKFQRANLEIKDANGVIFTDTCFSDDPTEGSQDATHCTWTFPDCLDGVVSIEVIIENNSRESVVYSTIVEGCCCLNDPYLGTWGQWSDCDAKCGDGQSTRSRQCFIPPCPSSDQCDGELVETRVCNVPVESINFSNYAQYGTITIAPLFDDDHPEWIFTGSNVDPFWDAYLRDVNGQKDVVTFTFINPMTVQYVSVQTWYAQDVTIAYGPGPETDTNVIGTDHDVLNLLTVSSFDMCLENVVTLTLDFTIPTSEMTANELEITVCLPDQATP